jgi:hypothetical protein
MTSSEDDRDITPERLNKLREELDSVTAAASELHERINASLAQSQTDHAVDRAARPVPTREQDPEDNP